MRKILTENNAILDKVKFNHFYIIMEYLNKQLLNTQPLFAKHLHYIAMIIPKIDCIDSCLSVCYRGGKRTNRLDLYHKLN